MLLSVNNLSKSYQENQVLRNLTLQADAGQVVSIIGSSGSGKSTALRCINFLEQPDSIDIRLGQQHLTVDPQQQKKPSRQQVEQLRRSLGMVFQHFNLWQHLRVHENCTLALRRALRLSREEAMERAMESLALVGMAEKADAYPNHLSGGQQQRVAIARALAIKPEVMLFDEPTSALDPELVGEVLEVMRKVATLGSTMLVVTHEMGFARELSDQIVFLHQGSIEEQGSPSELLDSPKSARLQQFLASRLK